MENRARELLPQVLLTLLSLIQAIALELLWSRIVESPHLYEGGVAAVAGWLQVGALVVGIVLVWLLYAGNVIRFLWVPSTRDSFFPFGIGLLEFSAVELLGPGHAAAWLGVMGAIYGLASWASFDMVSRALRETRGADSEVFGPAQLAIPLAAIALHAGLAMAVYAVGGYGYLAALSFAVVIAVLAGQTWLVHVSTRNATRPSGDEVGG